MSLLGQRATSAALQMAFQQTLNLLTVFVVSALVIRTLPREEYGGWALVVGYTVFFNFFNVSLAAILVRDLPTIRDDLGRYYDAFMVFAWLKTLVFVGVAGVIGAALYVWANSLDLVVLLVLVTVGFSVDNLAEPAKTTLSAAYEQKVISVITVVASVANLGLTLGVLWFPSAVYVATKNVAVSIVGAVLMRRAFAMRFSFEAHRSSMRRRVYAIRRCLSDFSLWSHISGIMTDVIYQADVLILSWVGVPFGPLGTYSAALRISNMGKTIPQILQYQSFLSMANLEPRGQTHEDVVLRFAMANFILSAATFLAYLVAGSALMEVVVGEGAAEAFGLGIPILAGICVFNTFRPLISYGMMTTPVRQFAMAVHVPAAAMAVLAYWAGAYFGGAWGTAWANLGVGVAMSGLVLRYVWRTRAHEWLGGARGRR